MSINDKNYVYGDQNLTVPPHLNFGKYLLDHMRKYKDNIALENGQSGEKITYREFMQYAVNLAMALKELGIGPGDTVAIASERRLHFLSTEIGIMLAGAAVTPYEPKIGAAVLKHKLATVKPQHIITSKLFWDNNKDILKSCDYIDTILTFEDELESAIPLKNILADKNVDIDLFEPVPIKGQSDVALILYSSGTTGLPKGVLLTHLNCILNSSPESFADPDLQTALVFGEWYHNYCNFMAFKFFAMGRRVVYANDLIMQNLPEIIEKCRVNIKMSIPAAVGHLAKAEGLEKFDLSSLKVLYSRSSPLHAKTMERIKERIPSLSTIMQGYGMTEAGELSSEVWGTKGTRLGSVGMPTPGYTLKITDLNTGKALGPNQNGEIRIRGPVLMKGYIGIDPSTYLDDEGFLKTGDLGYYDDDGYFFIIDRIKEIIMFCGLNVAPLELETILLLHPEVKEAGVVGKPADEEIGELPTAFVVRQPGSNVTEQELMDYVAGQVTQYMQLRGGVIFIDVLPRNQRGKILRKDLREMLKDTK